MRNWRNFFIVVLAVMLVTLAFTTAEAQNSDQERFANGFVVKGEFLRFYHSVPEPWFLFGLPISNEMSYNGTPVQYFDRARFELVSDSRGSHIQLANLGYFLFDDRNTAPSDVPTNSGACRNFATTQHKVCFKFLEFYDANNGPLYFGEPVSEALISNGQTVQYFEKARLEWRTNLPSDLQIGLTDVGWLTMQRIYGSTVKRNPAIIKRKPVERVEFQVNAFVSQGLVAPDAGNTVFVVVRTLDLKPIAGATVNLSINLPTGKTSLTPQATDVNGVAKFFVPAQQLSPKQIVPIQASVEYKGKTITASTWYRIWY